MTVGSVRIWQRNDEQTLPHPIRSIQAPVETGAARANGRDVLSAAQRPRNCEAPDRMSGSLDLSVAHFPTTLKQNLAINRPSESAELPHVHQPDVRNTAIHPNTRIRNPEFSPESTSLLRVAKAQ